MVLTARQVLQIFLEFAKSCSQIKNGGRDTKPAYKFMVIIPFLAIELKASTNGDPTNDMYWRRKSSSTDCDGKTLGLPVVFHCTTLIQLDFRLQ